MKGLLCELLTLKRCTSRAAELFGGWQLKGYLSEKLYSYSLHYKVSFDHFTTVFGVSGTSDYEYS